MLLPLMLIFLQDPLTLKDWARLRPDLAKAPEHVLRQWLVACQQAGEDPQERLAALEIYAQLGGANQLTAVLELLANDPHPQGLATLRAICQRDSRAFESLLAIAENSKDWRALACAYAGQLAPAVLPDPTMCEPVLLRMLGEPLESLHGEVVLLAGRLGSEKAVPRLVELMASGNEALRRDAHWSLLRITGLKLLPRAEDWEQWLGRERRWWDERAEQAVADLWSEQPAVQQRALEEIGERIWRRSELIPELERYLEGAAAGLSGQAQAILSRWQHSSAKEVRTPDKKRILRPSRKP